MAGSHSKIVSAVGVRIAVSIGWWWFSRHFVSVGVVVGGVSIIDIYVIRR